MITKRLIVIAAIFTATLLAIKLMPKSALQPTGLKLVDGKPFLPKDAGGWTGEDSPITEKEIATLGQGTQFARKIYSHPLDKNVAALTTLVLSGRDISNSLHRPERCLDAQGWAVIGSESVAIKVDHGGSFEVRRLHNQRSRRLDDGKTVTVEAYTYYWFVGEHSLESTHFGRFLMDNRDRLFRGVDQRWAFITVTAFIPRHVDPSKQDDVRKWIQKESVALIKDLAPQIHGPGIEYR